MHPNYVELLAAFREGRRVVRYGPGSRVRVTGGGEQIAGQVGVVVKVDRTRYQVKLHDGTWRIPFSFVERA